ncbi:ABC transporter permease [Flagellimonas algicola]|uniref:FtsX-like permease family protein n=1 Tax=Flagellimonas algicola TaxID=2583815 RepID=A0ABY2WP46_9FLAO|nr:ABC transporter permease [Allomuricauda algicola]TMU56512.1 FtsX-like permease family protein [Allomuricauda algicola]
MIKNYLKIAWRNSIKHKWIFSINIVGLALGIASCLVILLFVVDELSYDRYNEKAAEIVTVAFRAKVSGEEIKEGSIMAPVGETLKQEFPEVVDATRIRNYHTPKIIVDNQSFREDKFAFVDANFFDVFTLPIIDGDHKTPLNEPYTAVITKAEALKLFGASNAIGKSFYLNGNEQPFRVTGVIQEVPRNSHFHFDIFASMEGLAEAKSDSWFEGSFFTYLLLKEGADYKNLETKMPHILEKYMGPNMQEVMGMPYEEFIKENRLGFKLFPLLDIHLYSDNAIDDRLEQGGDIKYVYIFSAIALFMLLIACINFMNLSTATAAKRAKEVGIRKVLGSNKNQLLYQFLAESFIATLFAMFLAAILVFLSLPYYNELSGKELELTFLGQPMVLASLLLLTIFVSLLAGSYPAFFLSSFKPIEALKNKFFGSSYNRGVRSGLVVFQFIISAGLILATLVVNQQMQYIQNKDIGYERDQLLVIREAYLLGNDQTAFKNELLKNPKIASITQSAFTPAGDSDNSQTLISNDGQFVRRMPVYNIDENYIPTMGMELVSGRNFSKEFGADSINLIVNETAVKVLGLGENPLGKSITEGNNNTRTVIGVVKDFHFKSLHQPIDPLFLMYAPYGGLIIKAKSSDMSGLIADANSLWNDFGSSEPFGYTLLDDSYRQTYVREQKMGTVLNVFALLTILVACLGLLGLVTFTAEQRFKEIGIRKVLGSSVMEIVMMLSKDFSKLVLISFLIAFPLGYYLMRKWLEGFAYRIEIPWWLFVLAACATLLIALGTIGWKSFQAATMNPVKALRDD